MSKVIYTNPHTGESFTEEQANSRLHSIILFFKYRDANDAQYDGFNHIDPDGDSMFNEAQNLVQALYPGKMDGFGISPSDARLIVSRHDLRADEQREVRHDCADGSFVVAFERC